MRSFWRSKGIIFTILVLAIFFRFNNLNWDNNHHLHPDERFLTMVGNATKIPKNIFDYFNPQVSTLNPNNVGYNFFVYGTLPLTLNKILAVIFKNDNYNDFTIQGRFLSGMADLLIVLLVYKLVELLEKKYKIDKSIKYWSAFFYAIAVLPIQLSHFFTVDTFLSLFMFVSFYFALRFYLKSKIFDLIFSSIFFGLTMACKVSAVFILPLNILMIVLAFTDKKKIRLFKLFLFTIIYGLFGYFCLRFADPYMFKSNNFFSVVPNQIFIDSLKSLVTYSNSNVWYPPNVQWINNKMPIFFSFSNMTIFGVGIFYMLLVIIGVILNIKDQTLKWQTKNKKSPLFIMLLWTTIFFLYQSTQYVKTMRYFIFIYPFLAIFAGFGINSLLSFVKNKNIHLGFVICSLVICSIWPLMFSSVYMNKNSRVEASEWIYKNLPTRSIVLGELWDDQLPLYINNTYGKQFFTEQLPVFDYDTPEKWQKMNLALKQADYYVLSSNRGWGSISTASEKYPLMSKFYDDLLNNKTNYKIVKEFTSYPSLRWLGIPLDFPDQWSEEAFTVYDHQKVIILKNINKK